MPKINISNLNIDIDSQLWTIDQRLFDFSFDSKSPDIHCDVTFTNQNFQIYEEHPRIFYDDARSVYYTNNKICIIYNELNIPSCITASDDWSECHIYIHQAYNHPDDEKNVTIVKDGLLSALKTIFISAMASRNGILIHSASIEWQGKGVLFSAPSETGKSTHVHLWQEKYNVSILDGDVTACRLSNGLPSVYGLPWCGTSGEYKNASLPLRAIIFLEQDDTNSIIKLGIAEATIRLYARCFLYSWDEKLVDQVLETIKKIVSTTDCYLLKCRPDIEAVEMVKIWLKKE